MMPNVSNRSRHCCGVVKSVTVGPLEINPRSLPTTSEMIRAITCPMHKFQNT